MNLNLGKFKPKSKTMKDFKEYIEVFTQIDVVILDKLELRKKKNIYTIIDHNQSLEFPLKQNKFGKINVYSILSVLIELLQADLFSLVAIIGKDIYEPGNSGGNNY